MAENPWFKSKSSNGSRHPHVDKEYPTFERSTYVLDIEGLWPTRPCSMWYDCIFTSTFASAHCVCHWKWVVWFCFNPEEAIIHWNQETLELESRVVHRPFRHSLWLDTVKPARMRRIQCAQVWVCFKRAWGEIRFEEVHWGCFVSPKPNLSLSLCDTHTPLCVKFFICVQCVTDELCDLQHFVVKLENSFLGLCRQSDHAHHFMSIRSRLLTRGRPFRRV